MNIFKKKPYLTKEAGQFKFDFYYKEGKLKRTYLQISTTSGIWGMRVAGNTHAYGYLLAAATQDRIDQLQAYAVTLYIPVMELTQEQGLCNDIQKAIMKWQKRKEKESATSANDVTEAQNMADEAIMREAIERGKSMSRQQRRKAERESRKQMREVLNEDKEEKS